MSCLITASTPYSAGECRTFAHFDRRFAIQRLLVMATTRRNCTSNGQPRRFVGDFALPQIRGLNVLAHRTRTYEQVPATRRASS